VKLGPFIFGAKEWRQGPVKAKPKEGKGDEPMKRISIVSAAVLSSATLSGDGWALGLGELTLYSYLNEPFRAEVSLLEADALNDSDVHVDLASDAEFERLGVSRDFFLTRINFQVESDESGRRVVLTTEAPLREPYLDFVVEARWPDGRLLREYTVLIDLPPRPAVLELQDAPIERAAEPDNQAVVSGAETASADAGGYTTGASVRPVPGAQYLVVNTDTLWRIASDGAAPGVSVEQTMLEILAANPTAFQAGNINGLKSGYVLQIPAAVDIRIDLATALDEVALQNEEWAQGVARESQGLTLVADAETKTVEASEPAVGPSEIPPDTAMLAGSEAEPRDEAPLGVPTASLGRELEALIATVSRLQESVDSLETQLAERDAELASLRSALAQQQVAIPVPVAVETSSAPAGQPNSVAQPLPLWPFLAGIATLLIGGGLLIWRRIRRNTESESIDHADLKDGLPAEEIDEVSSPSRLSDPQIMVSKVVEEAQIYIAYGRTDQAVEVLSDALAEGLSSASLHMCLLECYVELEQFAEAGALLGRLEQGDSPELLERARQMLLDAGMTLASPSGDTVAQRSEERAKESEEASVLSELSFSADPAFALNDGQDAEPESEVESVDVVDEVPRLDAGPSAFEDPLVPEKSEAGQAASLSSIEDEQGLQLAPLEGAVGDRTPETGADGAKSDETRVDALLSPDTSGLELSPLDAAEIPIAESFDTDESIHGVETNPVDSKLDLARAYLDMGDEDGARPVLMEVIKEGDLPQQAEARELLLRLEAP
jgi:pilus assembly protein FimV